MRYVLLSVLGIVLLGIVGFVWLWWYSAIAPIAPPARTAFAPAAIQRGARLAGLGDCASCHTAPDGAPFAGGRKLQTPFGAVYTSNITPDRSTGIGTWSEAAFRRAMRQGVGRRGHLLYPAFPYDHFTLLSDRDDADLYAYLMTRRPVRATRPANDLPFPLDDRAVLAFWRLLFFHPGPYRANPRHDAAWNRGAYLAQGVAHCGACHTPRNFLGAETSPRFGGGQAQGWYAYPLDHASPAPTRWTANRIYAYLRHGWQAQHGDALGPMRAVTHDLSDVPDTDLRAIAGYIARRMPARIPAARPVPIPHGAGAALYRATCAACHDNSAGPPFAGIDLAKSSAPRASKPANLARIVLQGIPAAGEQPGPIMPGFAAALNNRQLGDLLEYIRARFGEAPAWGNLASAIKAARDAAAQPEAAQ